MSLKYKDRQFHALMYFAKTIQVQTSCGFGVPLLTTAPDTEDPESQKVMKPVLLDRDTMGHWSRKKIEKNELLQYQAHCNSSSIDGCPGMRTAMRDHGDTLWLSFAKARLRRILGEKDALLVGIVFGAALLLLIQALQKLLSVHGPSLRRADRCSNFGAGLGIIRGFLQ